MAKRKGMNRRDLMTTAIVAGAATLTGSPATEALAQPGPGLPGRGELVIRNAHVVTMDAALGEIENGDIHVRDGEIVAVGRALADIAGAETIDGQGLIALPGLIDTHNHLWNSTCRNLVQEGPERGYFATVLALGKQYTPEDAYRGVRLGVAEALFSGITTVHDWAHNIRSPEHADADVRVLIDCGIRGRFSYGTMQGGPPPDDSMDIADLERMHREWRSHANGGLLTLGMASRSLSVSPRGAVTLAAIHRDWAAARALGLPITLHTGAKGSVALLEREKLLGADVQLINSTAWDDADRTIAAAAGAHVSMSPFSEMRYSYALPQLIELIKLGFKVSLAIDTPPVAGTSDMFAQMRVLMDTQFVRTKNPLSVTARQVLEMATVNGAWDLGIADQVGSLTPGKRADIILLRATDLNMAPLADPVTAIVRCAQPHNVDLVMVDGRILKRDGRLTHLDAATVASEAARSLAELRRRAGRG